MHGRDQIISVHSDITGIVVYSLQSTVRGTVLLFGTAPTNSSHYVHTEGTTGDFLTYSTVLLLHFIRTVAFSV